MRPLRVPVYLESAHAANRLPRRRSRARAREQEGDFQREPPLPEAARCFAFGLDTETEINDGPSFVLLLENHTNKRTCPTRAELVAPAAGP